MKYWLKGAITGFIIWFAGFFGPMARIPVLKYLGVPSWMVNLWCAPVFARCVGDNCGCSTLVPDVIYLVFLVVIGAIIGLIIGRKSRV